MDRRSTLAGIAGAFSLLAAPALAQTTAPMAPPTPGSAEAKHIADTLAAGTVSLETSRVALKHASGAMVKEFAQFEVAEQETIAEILQPMAGNMTPPPAAKDMSAKLADMKGAAFDKAYVKAQIDGHHELLRAQETYLAAGRDPAQLAVAKLARGMIKEHLTLLGHLEKSA